MERHIVELFAKKKKSLAHILRKTCGSFGHTYRHLERETDVHQQVLRLVVPGLTQELEAKNPRAVKETAETKGTSGRRAPELAIPVVPYLTELLGLDTYFAFKVGIRDLLEHVVHDTNSRVAGGKKARDRNISLLRRLIRQLDQELRVLYPFKASYFRQVFAFSRARILGEVSQAALAEELAKHAVAEPERTVRLFEAGRLRFDPNEPVGKALVASLSKLLGRPMTWTTLDEEAKTLREVVRLDESLEARPAATLPRVQQIVSPATADDGVLEYSRTASPVPGLIVERFHAEYKDIANRIFRIIGAHHEGLEIAYVASGSVHVTFKRTPFAPETPDAPPTFTMGEDGVIHDEVLQAGALIFFRSPNYHRVHFLENTTLISVNLLHSIHLSGLTER